MFNNQYFRNIVGKPDWFYSREDEDCNPVGNAKGDPGKAQWGQGIMTGTEGTDEN